MCANRSEPEAITFLLGYYDAAGMSSRTRVTWRIEYPHANVSVDRERKLFCEAKSAGYKYVFSAKDDSLAEKLFYPAAN